MKIRNGFVSNSSSSSFVIVFPKDIKSVEEMGKILFKGDWEEQDIKYNYDETNPTTIWEVAERIYNDYIKSLDSKTIENGLKQFFINKQDICLYDYEDNISKLISDIDNEELIEVCTKMLELKKQHKVKYDKRGEAIEGSGYWNRPEYRKLEARKQKIEEEIGLNEYKSFIKTHKNDIILPLEYSDNKNDLEAIIEHQGIFNNLIHYRISNH